MMHTRKWFVLTCFCMLCVVLAWASLAKIDIIVRTQGRIIPAGKAQIVQHLEGGIITKLNVLEGQTVDVGQPLLELSDIQAKSSLGRERSNLDALRGKEARLLAESQGKSIQFPSDLIDTEIKKTEQAAFDARRAHIAEQIRVFQNQFGQRRGEISEAESRKRSLQAELELAKQQYKVIEGLRKENAASHLELLDSQLRIQKLTTDINEADAAIPRLNSAAHETNARVSEVWAEFRAQASSDLAQVRADIEKSSSSINTDADRVERNVVRAPVSGIVNRLSVTTIGGVVKPGEALMEITPITNGVLVEAKSQPNDRANLHPGLRARVMLGAYDYATYGTLDGEVLEVSADSIADEHDGRFYRVMINATTKDVDSAITPIPGMIASADIVVGKRTVLSYVLAPLLRFQNRALRDPR